MPDPRYAIAAVLVAAAVTWALRALPFAALAPLRESGTVQYLNILDACRRTMVIWSSTACTTCPSPKPAPRPRSPHWPSPSPCTCGAATPC
ncbi:hypothetical protein SGRIM128S_07025 [Streptomyces griseomycini]